MKKLFLSFIFLILCSCLTFAQSTFQGEIRTVYIQAKTLMGNKGKEDPNRRVSIYLPAGYNPDTKYPVVYYLHGFSWNDQMLFGADRLNLLLDIAIMQRKIRPFILVAPDAYTLFKGSFYTNSEVNGNWGDFIADELVTYVDAHFSTINNKNGRGLAGHSMGGHGALKIALLYPDRFSAVYALSPAFLGANKEWVQNKTGVAEALRSPSSQQLFTNFDATLMVAVGRAFSPNVNKPPFYCDLPFNRKGEINGEVVKLWSANTPSALLPTHIAALKGLKALAFDYGVNDEFKHIPITARLFANDLKSFGIPFTVQEYIGGHNNKIMTDDGRILNNLLPFFNEHLSF
jgi:enterochelin esterase-like enzyme